jgi:hypothetical protein
MENRDYGKIVKFASNPANSMAPRLIKIRNLQEITPIRQIFIPTKSRIASINKT